ncbi:MAG: hypothetical protein HC818_00095 [Synechococcaceae cyanobacterium RM1_1_27]|nr:hypothetical protein [Synechococcaceae cyanobacterium RM1_1_27]
MSTIAHYRVFAQDLKEQYQKGFLTASGYLFFLIKSLRKDGWKLVIGSIDQFCKEWGFARRTFYRAKAQLLGEGMIDFQIEGTISLWVTDAKDGTDGAKSGTPSATDDISSATDGVETPLSPSQDKDPSDSPDLSQIFNRSLPKAERDNNASLDEQPTNDLEEEALDLETDPGDLRQKISGSRQKPKGFGGGAAAKFEKELFEWVLKVKVPKLPTPPASPRAVARGWIRKHHTDLLAEYLAEVAQKAQPPRTISITEDYLPPDPLTLLRAKWNSGLQRMRDQVVQWIEANPEAGITINQLQGGQA